MKICDLTQAYNPTSGGIRTYIEAKRAYIAGRTDWEHLLIVPGETDRRVSLGRLTRYEIQSPKLPAAADYRLLLRLRRVAQILEAERPDLIELACPYQLPLVALFHRLRFGTAVVGYYHTDVPIAYVEAPLHRMAGGLCASMARWSAERYLRSLYNQFDATMVGSQALAERLSAIGFHDPVVTPLGIDAETFAPHRRDLALRERIGGSGTREILIYAGRLDDEKQVWLLVEALSHLKARPGLRLVMVGNGPLRGALQRWGQTDPRLVLLPYRSDKRDLAALLASADLYVTAGPFETFGLSVLEAQAAGLPVVGVDAGALRDRVDATVGRLVPPGDSRAMAEAIGALLDSDRSEMARNARRRAESHSWTATFDLLAEVYQRCVTLGSAAGVPGVEACAPLEA
ncbi:MAG: glycosyltransferase [Candidatus Eisenbacteria bacterium]|nr:glycosyltransferase [Candidatus Eisenbacteria bacterium]